MRKKVAVVSPGGLPVPNVYGGAVETGIQQIVEENEKHGCVDLIVYSIWNEKAQKLASEYHNTRFVFIRDTKRSRCSRIVRKIVNKILDKFCFGKIRFTYRYFYIKEIQSYIQKEAFDIVLIKNVVEYVEWLRPVVNNKLYLQIHNDFLNCNTYHAEQIYELCDLVIVNSEYIKTRVLTIADSDANKVAVNKNCIETKRFERNNLDECELRKWKERIGSIEGEKIILYSGRINPDKGVLELAKAVAQLPNNIPYRLVLMGSKWYGKSTNDVYVKKVRKVLNSVIDKVSILGFVPYDRVPYIYNLADILVVPSQWEEPAGRVVIEGQVSRVALIISDAGGMKEYTNSQAAIIIKRGPSFVENLKKSIIRLIQDEEYRKELSENGFACAQSYTSECYYKDIMSIMQCEES